MTDELICYQCKTPIPDVDQIRLKDRMDYCTICVKNFANQFLIIKQMVNV